MFSSAAGLHGLEQLSCLKNKVLRSFKMVVQVPHFNFILFFTKGGYRFQMEFVFSLLAWGIFIAVWVMSVFISSCECAETQNCSVSADRGLRAVVVLVPQANSVMFLSL